MTDFFGKEGQSEAAPCVCDAIIGWLTKRTKFYINLSRYCDKKRKAVKICRGRATVTGIYLSYGHCLQQQTGRPGCHRPEARRRLVTIAATGAARQYCLAYRQMPGLTDAQHPVLDEREMDCSFNFY
ncbi:hypothetical protein SDC9_02803 [bioreactor metagenome]|uniref:Uncharacterized protein n=1 Tax=bioreactor metagenome TaxID=1076179 RepID=A0A644SUE2_9ZZZZ